MDISAVLTHFLKDLSAQCEGDTFNDLSLPSLPETLNLKNTLSINSNEFIEFSPSNWTKFIEEHNFDIETIKLIISEGGIFWKSFFRWLFVYRFIKSKKDGEALKKEGWQPGEEMGNEIKRLRYLEIDKISKK